MQKEIVPSISFDIYQDTLVFKDRLVKIAKIEPVDILLMSNLEKQNFKRDLYSLLNSLSSKHKIQIIYYARQAINADYQKHFENLQSIETNFASSDVKQIRNERLEAYIEELQGVVDNNLIPKREFFIILSVNKKDGDKLTHLLTVIDDFTAKTLSSLRQAGFACETIIQKPLHQFLKTNIRYV